MANILYYKLEFFENNPYGTFVAGDVVDMYYDDSVTPPTSGTSTTGVVVHKNGSQILTGADIVVLSAGSYKTATYMENVYNPLVCYTTRAVLLTRANAFPYAVISSETSSLCNAAAPVCDLLFSGTPTITGASSSTASDGSVTVTASSTSTPIEYKLSLYNFTYGDGTGQSTGVFSGLAAGQYRIYARDSKNCSASILITIPVTDSYSPKFRLSYNDLVGGVTKIDITQRAYSGAITRVKGTNAGLVRSLKGEGSQDKFESILATKATVNLTSESTGAFSGIYTNNPDEFRINYYKDDVLKGVYKVLPQQFGEEHTKAPFYVSLVATDGLPSLKEYVFLKDDGQRFNGSMKAITLIAYILKKTKLELSIRVGINLYATAMNSAASDDPLDQAYVDCDTYYINEKEPTLDYVLRQIIEPFGASIVQENAVWNIVRVEEKRASYDYREFDYNGTYVSNSSYDPRLDVVMPNTGATGFYFSDRDHYRQLCPGYGKIRVYYKLGLRPNILENGDFRLTSVYSATYNQYLFDLDTTGFQLVSPDYTLFSTWESIGEDNVAWKIEGDDTIVANTGEAYILSDTYNIKMGVANTLKISIRYKLPPPVVFGLTPTPIAIPYQKVRVRVKYGSNYLLSDGTWSTSENFLIIYATEFDKFLETDFIATQPNNGATAGYDFEVRVYHSYIFHAEFTTFALLRGKDTYNETTSTEILPVGTRSEVSALGAFEELYYYELEENTSAESEPSIIRPADYHATNNPVQWILKKTVVKAYYTAFTSPFWIDYIKVKFLTSGSEPVDTIIREINAESKNIGVLEKEITHGSYHSLITTIPQWDFGVGKLTATTGATLSLITTNIISASLLYAGYFRSSAGAGYATWVRDGVSESTSLHAILLQQYAAQYKKSWMKLTGTFYSDNSYFNFLNVLRITTDSDKLYLPISPTIDDRHNRVSGEFLELTDITASAGSNGSSGSPFTSGFTTGFGASYN